MKSDHIGSSFEDFLREEGIYEEVEAGAIKNVTVCMIEQSMIERTNWGHPLAYSVNRELVQHSFCNFPEH